MELIFPFFHIIIWGLEGSKRMPAEAEALAETEASNLELTVPDNISDIMRQNHAITRH